MALVNTTRSIRQQAKADDPIGMPPEDTPVQPDVSEPPEDPIFPVDSSGDDPT